MKTLKQIFHLMMAVLAGASVVSCQNFLSASSPSTVDADFVFSSYETGKTVMLGAYNTVTGSYTSGLPTNFDDIGSDTERCSVGMVAYSLRFKKLTKYLFIMELIGFFAGFGSFNCCVKLSGYA